MSLIIPGVEVRVVKEVLPKQLAPSGVLGLIGFVEKPLDKVERASSWARFLEVFGPATAHSLPEARQALDNGVSELVISPLARGAGATATYTIPGGKKARLEAEAKALRAEAAAAKKDTERADKNIRAEAKEAEAAAVGDAEKSGLKLVARAPGLWANDVQVTITRRDNIDKSITFDISLKRAGREGEELFRGVGAAKLGKALEGSALVKLDGYQPGVELDDSKAIEPAPGTYRLSGGQDAARETYRAALDRLTSEPDVDMVLAAVQDFNDVGRVASIYEDVIIHSNAMSSDCKGRVGFGQVRPNDAPDAHVKLASRLVSDRFVLVAPHGVVGATAGMIGSLPYYHSPTFKPVSGVSDLSPLAVEDQKALLRGNVVPVALEHGKGVVVLRGLTTDGDQISVRRVADHAVRVMNMVGRLFIGLLNNADGRAALKQKLVAELLQMEKDGAIVPSTDAEQPAFQVDVHSSQDDFAKGIVRVNMAVRPVRAIDYIYATITVQV